MIKPTSLQQLFDGDVCVINMERSKERWEKTRQRILSAGFREASIHRLPAVDASHPVELNDAWKTLFPTHPPTMGLKKDPEFSQYPGKQGCFLSHVKLWKHMIDHAIPFATVFEDDILFHPHWDRLAPDYFSQTPANWDMIYLGCQMDFKSPYHIDKGPVYCTHAMVLTLDGATKLYEMVSQSTANIYTIDNYFHDLQLAHQFPLNYYIWNGQFFPSVIAQMPRGWDRRNHGLVFQDETMGSYIKDHY
jgi:GR25 family glycosyltransferase involved in LPS biosynthesis